MLTGCDVDVQNPFADPAVQAGLNSHAHEEYDAASFKGASTYDLPDQQAAAASGNADMQARLADLQRREQELAVSPCGSAALAGVTVADQRLLPAPLWVSGEGNGPQAEAGAHSETVSLRLESSTKHRPLTRTTLAAAATTGLPVLSLCSSTASSASPDRTLSDPAHLIPEPPWRHQRRDPSSTPGDHDHHLPHLDVPHPDAHHQLGRRHLAPRLGRIQRRLGSVCSHSCDLTVIDGRLTGLRLAVQISARRLCMFR